MVSLVLFLRAVGSPVPEFRTACVGAGRGATFARTSCFATLRVCWYSVLPSASRLVVVAVSVRPRPLHAVSTSSASSMNQRSVDVPSAWTIPAARCMRYAPGALVEPSRVAGDSCTPA